MKESEQIERLAKRYIEYLGLDEEKLVNSANSRFKISVGGFKFSSYKVFLFGNGMSEYSYNQLEAYRLQTREKATIPYSSVEELDFKLSAIGF